MMKTSKSMANQTTQAKTKVAAIKAKLLRSTGMLIIKDMMTCTSQVLKMMSTQIEMI